MEYRYLASTGVQVSALCLGCLTFGREDEGYPTEFIRRVNEERTSPHADRR